MHLLFLKISTFGQSVRHGKLEQCNMCYPVLLCTSTEKNFSNALLFYCLFSKAFSFDAREAYF